MKKQFKDMAEKRQPPNATSAESGSQKQRGQFNVEGDYIPFEEVK